MISSTVNTKYGKYCIDQISHAEYGCSEGIISIDFSPEYMRLANQLHESLHFFNVDDCYESEYPHNPKYTCDNKSRVMRYGVDSLKVCGHVLSKLRESKY